jgi:hypothetical protein
MRATMVRSSSDMPGAGMGGRPDFPHRRQEGVARSVISAGRAVAFRRKMEDRRTGPSPVHFEC